MNQAHMYLSSNFNVINFISVFHKAVIEIKKIVTSTSRLWMKTSIHSKRK